MLVLPLLRGPPAVAAWWVFMVVQSIYVKHLQDGTACWDVHIGEPKAS
jgi:hypothetical protein